MELGNIHFCVGFVVFLSLLRMIPSFHNAAAATVALGWYLRILGTGSPLWPLRPYFV